MDHAADRVVPGRDSNSDSNYYQTNSIDFNNNVNNNNDNLKIMCTILLT